MSPRERLVDVADTRLLLREWGAEGPAILFFHALGDHNSMQMVEAGPILADEFGFRVIGVDAPGFGGSPPLPLERYEISPLVALYRDLLDDLDVERPVWAGSSWGAIVGVHFAAEHAARLQALVLLDGGYVDPGHDQGQSLEELREHWRDQPGFRYPSWDTWFAEARGYFGRWSRELEDAARSTFREEGGEIVSIMGTDVYAAAIHGIQRSQPSLALDGLGRTALPVLLLAATEPQEDEELRATSLERFGKRVPQAEIRRLEGAPHFLLEARPDEVARTVGEWLRALPYP